MESDSSHEPSSLPDRQNAPHCKTDQGVTDRGDLMVDPAGGSFGVMPRLKRLLVAGEKLIDVAASVEPGASSKCLIFLAVAVVEVKISRGVYVDAIVVAEGSQTDREVMGSDDGFVIRPRKCSCANCAP
jgi:hypothetical protein